MALAAGSGSAPAPLSCQITFTGGAGPINVSGASGDMYTQFGYLISVIVSGGTPPYGGVGTGLSGDSSGKLSFAPASDGLHNTLFWSGFTLNEIEGCYLTYNATDDAGATASARYPASGNIVIKRTS